MFFVKHEERTMTLHPSFFGPNIPTYLFSELLKAVEGTANGDYFIITCMGEPTVSEGRILPGNGRAEFRMNYRAICWKPFKGEVVDGIVSNVTETGIFVEVGPLSAFVSKSMIPREIQYNAQASPPHWAGPVGENGGKDIIEKGVLVRIRLKGIRPHLGSLSAVASINEDYLGYVFLFLSGLMSTNDCAVLMIQVSYDLTR
jgi:DNA-directed RNA polymerase II subunit RPB7